MPQPEHLDPSPYAADNGPVGVLLVHGLSGSTAETRPLGEYLADRGMSVRCPLLAGHGRTEADLLRVRWQQWTADVELALDALQNRCTHVFAGGLSLGALLVVWLGLRRPDLAGLITMAPPVKVRSRLAALSPLMCHVLRYVPPALMGGDNLGDPEAHQRIWCYDRLAMQAAAQFYLLQRRICSSLSLVRQPLLIFQGLRDPQVPPPAAQLLFDSVSSADRTLVWLENSGHNLLVDGERHEVWARSHGWIMDRAHGTDRRGQ